MRDGSRVHPLDRPAARLAAVGIALAAVAVLGVIHRDDLTALASGAPAAPVDPQARCIAGHHATIDKGVSDGVFRPDQAALFKQRAEAMCRSTVPQ